MKPIMEDFHCRGAMELLDRSRLQRPIRNKRCNRKYVIDSRRQPKRLFTPEIKKYLKDWLIRRRENPYPNREEKKSLAMETGLTYVQVCNWFANWRRKLKSVGKEMNEKTWGNLIRTYNSRVQGNLEHFSISSEDSIWQELESATDEYCLKQCPRNDMDAQNNGLEYQERVFYPATPKERKLCASEKMTEDEYTYNKISKPSMIFRWLQSATNFKPCEQNYLVYCNVSSKQKVRRCEELAAAETLTALANSFV